MKSINTSGRRKRAIARASVTQGTGKIFINNISIDQFEPALARQRLLEPVQLSEGACDKIDIHVRTNGGGFMGQTEAARLAIARAIVEHSKSNTLRQAFIKYDRHLLVADVRRKEMRKPNDSKARAKRQKSYR
jgi:small subunit ribosomal protein S9